MPTRARSYVAGETTHPHSESPDRTNLLLASELFAGLSPTECAHIALGARPRVFARGELLFMQGQAFSRLVLVESGCVKLTRLSLNGNEVILGMRGPREIIDLPFGPTVSEHSCTARAVIGCRALTWDWHALERITQTTPKVSRNIACVVMRQLHELQERYHEMSAENVGRRLACTLIRLGKQFGVPTDRGSEILISRQELAQMVGATLFTVSRLIARWGELGLILPRREAILMIDADGLDRLSSSDPSPVASVFPVIPVRKRIRNGLAPSPPFLLGTDRQTAAPTGVPARHFASHR